MNSLSRDLRQVGSGRRALGKGLDSLLPRVSEAAVSPAGESEGGKPLEVAVDKIDRNPYQTRTQFDEQALDELAGSIAANGVLQPILVRPQADGRFQLIAGERRWLASKRAGKTTVPAMLKVVSDEQALEITIIENLQREDLNPIEQARAFERLSREFGMTQEQMAQRTGKDRQSIGNYMRLLKLPESIQSRVENGILNYGHARTLVVLPYDVMERAAQKMVASSMSVRDAEDYVQQLINPGKKRRKGVKAVVAPIIDPNVADAQERLQRALGLRVRIEDTKGRGRVIIEYARLEDFDALMDLIAGNR